MLLPFGLLLALIALGPLLLPSWWARHYSKAALALAAVTLAYYFFGLRAPRRVLETAHEYLGFILLIGSLYVVSGGIHINVKGEATPFVNVVFLLIGAVLANVLGTTGASMLLIRPWLRMNKHRVTAHHIVFFIFIVSNVGGCLTPIGDPPLFLGYLWAFRSGGWRNIASPCGPSAWECLLAMFWMVDYRNFCALQNYPAPNRQVAEDRWRFDGLANVFFLAVIIAAVFVDRPPFLREGLMALAALGSWFTTRKTDPRSEPFRFSSHPGSGHSVHRHFCHDDAGAGLAARQCRPP